MIKYLRLLLLPFNPIYALVIFVRNTLFNLGYFKSTSFNKPIICIGNLAVGGSGKTPTTEYLVNLLADKKIAILSRGYGRKTKGFILADENATAETIGDEPLQYFNKFESVTVAVCEDRVKGIQQLIANHDVILLDDAYQHRRVKAGFNILLFEYAKLKKWQMLLPAGNLRETFAGVKRAQSVLITKSPLNVSEQELVFFEQKLNLKSSQNLAFASIEYQNLKHLYNNTVLELKPSLSVFLLTGIANPEPLKAYLKTQQVNVQSFEYPDHHRFTENEIKNFVSAFEKNTAEEKIIITTEKDGQRLLSNNLKDLLLNLPVYYLPITIGINQNDKTEFEQKILAYVART